MGSINIDFGAWSGNSFSVNTNKASQSVQVNSANNNLSSLAEYL